MTFPVRRPWWKRKRWTAAGLHRLLDAYLPRVGPSSYVADVKAAFKRVVAVSSEVERLGFAARLTEAFVSPPWVTDGYVNLVPPEPSVRRRSRFASPSGCRPDRAVTDRAVTDRAVTDRAVTDRAGRCTLHK